MTGEVLPSRAQHALRVIGMISGTSFDAVEAVAADLALVEDVVECEVIAHRSVAFPSQLRAEIAAILPPASTTVEAVCRLDAELGRFLADIADTLRIEACDGRLDAVASHGQTVYHWIEDGIVRGSLQLGQPAWIAEKTGATVVADIRARDIAAGGQGAPLASLVDVLLLGAAPGPVRGALNIGGIANMTVLRYGHDPIAFDIGPGNALIDAAVAMSTSGAELYDRDGAHAAAGTLDEGLLAELAADPYYGLPAPKSTGKEHFNAAYLGRAVDGRGLALDDLAATLTELTAQTIAHAAARHGVEELVVSGGGTRNTALMRAITRLVPAVPIRATDAYGVPEAAKEALLVALIGFLTLRGRPSTVPSATGARRATVLGAIIPGRAFGPWSVHGSTDEEPAVGLPRALIVRPSPIVR
jgi:anhydro-N-acetylmuramic acid kinase